MDDLLLDLSSEVVLVCERSGAIRWFDARAQRLLGMQRDLSLQQLVLAGGEDKASRLVEAACAGTTEVWELIHLVRGSPMLVAWRGAPSSGGAVLVGNVVPQHYAALQDQVADVMGEFTRVQRDTERQRRDLVRARGEIEQLLQAEQASRMQVEAERARLQQVLDGLPEAIVIIDADLRFVIANAAATDIMGGNLVGHVMPSGEEPAFDTRRLDGVPLPARELPLARSALRGEVIRGEQLLLYHAQNGHDVPLLVNSAPLFGPGGVPAGAVAVFQDISAIKDVEREKDEFLASVSHDLRNPLAGIRGWAQILRRRAARLPEAERDRWRNDLTTIETAATRMGTLIDELLDLTHVQMGRALELRPGATDLLQLARRVIADHQQLATRHSLQVCSDVEQLVGEWDPARLERVVGNLVSNAIKYSPEGGEVRITVAREECDGAGWAVLTVQDQGVGIPQEDLPRIFERFYRASNVASQIAGTGIGLAGAKQLVELHGGSIEVHSVPERGSTFVVRLPLLEVPGDE
jgi:signal transduction histidine kinase